MTLRLIVICCASLAASAPVGAVAGTVMFARGTWAAIDRGGSCVALARSARIAARDKVQATAGFTFTADRSRWGEFHARLSRVPRPGSSVILTVGNQPFLLVAGNVWAWSRGPAQEQAMIAAARLAGGMRIEARDLSGRRFVDRYALAGAPTAIDSAAARCAGKMQRR